MLPWNGQSTVREIGLVATKESGSGSGSGKETGPETEKGTGIEIETEAGKEIGIETEIAEIGTMIVAIVVNMHVRLPLVPL